MWLFIKKSNWKILKNVLIYLGDIFAATDAVSGTYMLLNSKTT